MKKILSIGAFFVIILLVLFYSNEIMQSINLSFKICIGSLFPSLIPLMIFSNILINYNFIYDLSNIFNNLMTKTFRINKNCSFAFIMGLISGTPSNSKYLKDLLDKNLINIEDCQKALAIFQFINPIFILNTIGVIFLDSKKLGLIILISNILSNIILSFFYKKTKSKIDCNKPIIKNNNFVKTFNNSVISTFNTLLLILGVITTCLIFTTILNQLLNINYNYKFLFGIIEITQGINYLSLSNINVYVKTIITSFLLAFGGLSIHIQVFSILDNKKIRYLPYLIYRIIQAAVSSILTAIFIKIIY